MTDFDIEGAINIWDDAMPPAHKGIPHEHWRDLLPTLKDELKWAGDRYVYVEDQAILGFIAMKFQSNYIFELCVDYNARRQGIGKKLVDRLKSTHDYLTLHVFMRHAAPLLYRQLNRKHRPLAYNTVNQQLTVVFIDNNVV